MSTSKRNFPSDHCLSIFSCLLRYDIQTTATSGRKGLFCLKVRCQKWQELEEAGVPSHPQSGRKSHGCWLLPSSLSLHSRESQPGYSVTHCGWVFPQQLMNQGSPSQAISQTCLKAHIPGDSRFCQVSHQQRKMNLASSWVPGNGQVCKTHSSVKFT